MLDLLNHVFLQKVSGFGADSSGHYINTPAEIDVFKILNLI